jgi:hypothetical protein
MELTPELFEKTEFAERRKGYDIDQVETFMEDAGTALAQMLARVRHTEERAAHAESRLSQVDELLAAAEERVAAAEARAQAAERAAADARAQAAQAAAIDESAEVEQAAKTLLMAKRTAEATVNEARGQAQSLLEDAEARAQHQLREAETRRDELLREATERAEQEFAQRRAAALEEVQALEARRAQLADVIAQLEERLSDYRDDLGRAAHQLLALAEDPAGLGPREAMSMSPDEVIVAEGDGGRDSGPAVGVSGPGVHDAGHVEEPQTAETVRAEPPAQAGAAAEQPGDAPPAPAGSGPVPAGDDAGEPLDAALAEDDAERTEYVDLTAGRDGEPASGDDRWGPGSWAEVEATLDEVEDDDADRRGVDRPTEAVERTGTTRDRFLEELDSAVNEAVELDDDAMTAFFEGTGEARTRRFGWRR